MKKLIFILLVLSAGYHNESAACNACGCSAANPYIGLLPQTSTTFIGLQYIGRRFHTDVHEENSGITESAKEYYQTLQLWGRVQLSKKIQLIAFVPYVSNTQREENEAVKTLTGMGDATVIANYKLVSRDDCSWHHTLIAGGGLKLPTGKYNAASVESGTTLPNMQPGTHSLDYVANINYTVRRNQVGANIDGSYVATSASKEDYKFGNRTSIGVAGFYQLQQKKYSLLPQAGIRYDNAGKDYTYYSSRSVDADAGGWQLYASQSIQAYYKKLGLQFTCYEPISQDYFSGFVKTKFRFETGVIVVLN